MVARRCHALVMVQLVPLTPPSPVWSETQQGPCCAGAGPAFPSWVLHTAVTQLGAGVGASVHPGMGCRCSVSPRVRYQWVWLISTNASVSLFRQQSQGCQEGFPIPAASRCAGNTDELYPQQPNTFSWISKEFFGRISLPPPPIFPLQLAWDEGEGQPASLPARAGEGGPSYQRHSRPWPVSPPGKADARHANRHLESAGELRAPKAAKPQRGIFPESHFSLPKSPHPLGFRGCPSKRNIPRWQGPPK